MIEYDDRVLQPRAWTAQQSVWAADLLPDLPSGPVLELCAGAGQIGLLAVVDSPRALVAVDVSPAACELARRNARRAGLGDRVEVREGDMAAVLDSDEHFALVLADPPYLLPQEADRYPADPRLAIEGGADGMDLVWRCVEVAGEHLLPGGVVLLQLRSNEQADRLDDVHDLMAIDRRDHGCGVVVLLRRR